MLNIFKKKERSPKEQMIEVLGDYELPTFPTIILSALEMVRDKNAPHSEIADLVATDPGLSVRLLTTVNSAAYSLMHKVNSIDHAVSLLGRGELESILISMAVRQVLPRNNIEGFNAVRFWRTAARRAATARALADMIDPSTRSESFTAALLQDMAIPILARQRARDYGPVLEHWYSSGMDLAVLERDTFGWDHAKVAMWMCNDWDFPERISHAIGAHHGPNGDVLSSLPAVNLVGVLREHEQEHSVEQLVEAAYSDYGLVKDKVAGVVGSSFVAAEEISSMFY